MEYNYNQFTSEQDVQKYQASYITKVYGWMFGALLITAITALYTASSNVLLSLIYGTGFGFYILIGAQILVVLGISGLLKKINSVVATILFIVYAILTGFTFSALLIVYSTDAIFTSFLTTSLTFGIMSAVGYFTKTDLTKLGKILMMGLIGVIVASVVNWFMKSDTVMWIVSYVGLFIFIGLVAYDTQKIKRMALESMNDIEAQRKGTILGALSLYLDFINIFIYILRITGRD